MASIQMIEPARRNDALLLPQVLQRMPLGVPLACIVLAIGWLLPNHHRPWVAFHSDAWVAASMTTMLVYVLIKSTGPYRFTASVWALFLVSALPWLQHFLGTIPLAGDAWVSFAYLFGFALAAVLGELGTMHGRSGVVDFLLGAIGIAAIVSVVLQLYQWFGLTRSDGMLDIWVLFLNDSGRPYANMGQPNQLATLLLWGLIAVAWALEKRLLGPVVAVPCCALLLFGLVLTQSRTAVLTLCLLFALALFGRGWLFPRVWLWTAAVLLGFFFAFTLMLGRLGNWLLLDIESSIISRTQGESRLEAWRMFIDGALARPWLGYGIDHSKQAQLEVFPKYPAMADQLYSHAHNLFLDLVLWTGIPIGIALSYLIIRWMFQNFIAIRTRDQALLFAAVLVVGIHAMLELPLHYAYFLLPTGVMVGALNQLGGRRKTPINFGRPYLVCIVLAAAVLLAVIARDYFRIEKSHLDLRFEAQRIGVTHKGAAPDTWLLTHWRDLIALGRDQPVPGMHANTVDHWRDLALYYPSPANFEKLLKALAMNGRRSEAEFWSLRTCAFIDEVTCRRISSDWRASAPVPPGLPPTSPP